MQERVNTNIALEGLSIILMLDQLNSVEHRSQASKSLTEPAIMRS